MIALEFSLMVVSIIACLMLVAFAGRFHEVSGSVSDAAAEAARSASLKQSSESAINVAFESASTQLSGICENLSVVTNTENFKPGGSVVVRISCGVPLLGLSLLAIPPEVNIQFEATEIIDRYRT